MVLDYFHSVNKCLAGTLFGIATKPTKCTAPIHLYPLQTHTPVTLCLSLLQLMTILLVHVHVSSKASNKWISGVKRVECTVRHSIVFSND